MQYITAIDYKGKPIQIQKGIPVAFQGKKKINIGCMRWILAFLIFMPLVLLIFFVGDTVYEVEANNVKYHLNEAQYNSLYTKIYP